MNNKDIKLIAVSGIIMLVLDFIFLAFVMKDIFHRQIIKVQRVDMTIRYGGAIACYILLIFGLYYFILREKKSVMDAFFFGLVIYGVYETTTYAVLKKWDLQTVIIDSLWGGVLMALTTYLTYEFL